jgi:hypothetical protein
MAWIREHERSVAIATLMGSLLLVGIAFGLAVGLTRDSAQAPGGSASPMVSPTPTAPAPTSDESSPPPSVTPSSTPEAATPTPAPTVPERPTVRGWSITATIDLSPRSGYVTDITAWDGGFIAIGSVWDSEFHVGKEMPAMWISSDGRSWAEQPIELGVDDVTLIGVAARTDGSLLLVGRLPGSGANPEAVAPVSAAWVSADASSWDQFSLPLSEDAVVDSFTHARRGFAIGASTPTPGEIWFSPDGIEWTKTFEGASSVEAGDEGFVAVQQAQSSVVASGDGRTWYPTPVAAPLFEAEPVGGDWVAQGSGTEANTTVVSYSPNGLEWTEVLDVNELTGPDGPKTGRGLDEAAINFVALSGGPGHAFLTLGNNHCCAQAPWSYGVWWTTDGATWVPMAEGDYHVDAVAENGDVVVLGGHTGRGISPTFWIGER